MFVSIGNFYDEALSDFSPEDKIAPQVTGSAEVTFSSM